jgi:hypothetical protein
MKRYSGQRFFEKTNVMPFAIYINKLKAIRNEIRGRGSTPTMDKNIFFSSQRPDWRWEHPASYPIVTGALLLE